MQFTHNPDNDIHVPARRPKTPPRLTELKVDDIDSGPHGGRASHGQQAQPAYPTASVKKLHLEDAETAKLPSPNNTPLTGSGMESFGSMNKPSPNNTPMSDRYVQDRGAKYPDDVPDAPSTPPRTKDNCEVRYGGASPNLDRDNGSSWSETNHIKSEKK